MNLLAEMGTEIMWCDIGGPNCTLEFASQWFNRAADQNRQVVMNSIGMLDEDYQVTLTLQSMLAIMVFRLVNGKTVWEWIHTFINTTEPLLWPAI